MKRNDINILIIEDDSTVRNALKEAFSRAGYTVKATGQPHEAKRYFSLDNYQLLIVDCMLPKINGVDLVESLKKEHGRQFKTILTSGVFKNSTFSKDALHKTQAEHFLYKPIDIEEILEIAQQFFADVIEEEKDPLFELMTHEELSPEDIQEAIEKTETIQGHDLPMIYGFLVHAKSNGMLNLVDKDGEQSSILFVDGEIIEVQVNDKMSYFGILLIENGFTSTEEVERNLQASNEKPIGLRLVEAHAMSPHAINIALSQQMSIRLSKTIQNNSYSISFTPSQLSIKNTKIPAKQFHRLLIDWVYSKIEDNWLIQFYLPWMDYKLHRVKNQKLLGQLNDLPAMKSIAQIFKYADEEITLGELVNEATQ
ncbi:MAG: response regulator transcription factor, partial [Bdellovibrionales bacterium]|nr:response regulator transcription factor [Bdellovibrionales bacterium]